LVLDAADLVVVDAHLPDGDGLAFGRRLRSYLGCGVILCLAEADKALRIACLREGADACLVHPVDPEELEATLISVHRCLHSPVPKLLPALVPSPWVL
jgi:DNA-binding response OmpR family regulator